MERTFTTAELAEAAGVKPRTIRHYSFLGLLTKPVFRGKATTYSEENLAQVLAARAMMGEMRADRVKAAMAKMTAEEIREKAGLPAAKALPLAQTSTAPVAPPMVSPRADSAPPAPHPPAPAPPPPAPPEPRVALGEDWSRVALLPGLELHVRSDAKDFVRRVAREIREKYATS